MVKLMFLAVLEHDHSPEAVLPVLHEVSQGLHSGEPRDLALLFQPDEFAVPLIDLQRVDVCLSHANMRDAAARDPAPRNAS